MLVNCHSGKKIESPLDCKEVKPINPKGNQSWIFMGRIDPEAETPILWPPWCKKLTHLKRPWCWERLKAGEGDDRGWDGWMASPTRWAWVLVNSGSWWWTERPGVLRFMESQRVGDSWATELNWSSSDILHNFIISILVLTCKVENSQGWLEAHASSEFTCDLNVFVLSFPLYPV